MGDPGRGADSRVKVSLGFGGLRFLGLLDRHVSGGHPWGGWRQRER